jgi:hypothetical protein
MLSGKTDNIFVGASAAANISTTAIGILMKPGVWVSGTIPQNPNFFYFKKLKIKSSQSA